MHETTFWVKTEEVVEATRVYEEGEEKVDILAATAD